jgi:peroxiredoxin
MAAMAAPPAPMPTSAAVIAIGGDASDVVVVDERGNARRLADWEPGRVLVVAFVSDECPLAELYAERLAELAGRFGPRGVGFVGLAPSRRDSTETIAGFAAAHHLEFPVVADDGARVAARLGATRTPSVVVLDRARAIRYRGRIDDQYRRETRRAQPGRCDLAAALEALLADRPIVPPETESVGCPIGSERPDPETDRSSIDYIYTYERDVAPILTRRCVSCHRKGQAAPFALTTYRQASGWAEAMAEAVEERRMPPWYADPRFGRFANDPHLSEPEIATLVAWARGGRAKGDPRPVEAGGSGFSEVEAASASVSAWSINQPDLVLAIPRPFSVPAQGIIDYQQFEVDPGFREDRWVAAAEIQPGNRAVVHHCTVFLKPPGAVDPEYTPGALGSFCLEAMAPGTPPMVLPPGMAKRIPAGWTLVFVLHYTTNGTPQTDRTRIGLRFAPAAAVRREVLTRLLYDPDLAIPPHASDYRVEQSWQAPADLLLLAMFPHMHLRGKSFRYEADYPDGTTETLLFVPRYDFNWQPRYVLATPKRLPAGTTVRCIAHYDNSAANPANPDPGATVRTGKQNTDEMFNGYFDIALADQDLTRPGLIPPASIAVQRSIPRPLRPPLACLLMLTICAIGLRLVGRCRGCRRQR